MVDVNKRAKKKADPVVPPTQPEDFHKKAGTWSTITSAFAAAVVAVTGAAAVFISPAADEPEPEPTKLETPQSTQATHPDLPPPVTQPERGQATGEKARNDQTRDSRPPNPFPTIVSAPVLQMVPEPPARPAPPVYQPPNPRAARDLRIRDQPNEQSDTIAILRSGTPFLVGERMGNYYYVVLPDSDTRGFLQAEIVDQIRTQQAQPNQRPTEVKPDE